jgi:hypothetical protein
MKAWKEEDLLLLNTTIFSSLCVRNTQEKLKSSYSNGGEQRESVLSKIFIPKLLKSKERRIRLQIYPSLRACPPALSPSSPRRVTCSSSRLGSAICEEEYVG